MARCCRFSRITLSKLLYSSNAPSQLISRTGISYKQDKDIPADFLSTLKERRGGQLLNLDRIMLHSPTFTKGWMNMFYAIRSQLSVNQLYRELSIMAIAIINEAEYEWVQHEGEFLRAGGTKEHLNSLKKGIENAIADHNLFDEKQRATLKLTYEMTKNVKVAQETMDTCKSLFSEQELVELIGTIAGYNMVSRFLIATGVEIEA